MSPADFRSASVASANSSRTASSSSPAWVASRAASWWSLIVRVEQVDDLLRQFVEAVVCGEPQIRMLGPLIRAADPGEVRDLAGACFGVQTLRIPLLTLLDRCVAENFVELQSRIGVHSPSQFAVLNQRTD